MPCFLSKGSKGEKVVQLQNGLKTRGYYVRQVDGDYGQFTEEAVKKYQKAKGLEVDGCVGDQTWNSLFNVPPTSGDWKCVMSYQKEMQDKDWTCGPSSSVMALSELGVRSSEAEMANHEEVTKDGVGHGPLMKGIKKQGSEFGVNLSTSEASFNNTGWEQLAQWIADPKVSVIVHGRTEGWRRYYIGNYGHYVFPVGINLKAGKIRIADPARNGVLEYTLNEFKKGMDMQSQPSLIVIKK